MGDYKAYLSVWRQRLRYEVMRWYILYLRVWNACDEREKGNALCNDELDDEDDDGQDNLTERLILIIRKPSPEYCGKVNTYYKETRS
jgi:hypothetical protein